MLASGGIGQFLIFIVPPTFWLPNFEYTPLLIERELSYGHQVKWGWKSFWGFEVRSIIPYSMKYEVKILTKFVRGQVNTLFCLYKIAGWLYVFGSDFTYL